MLLCTSSITEAQIYTFKNYDHSDGLILSSVLTVNEAENGYIWFGTDGAGLMRFDGKNFDYLEKVQKRTNRHVNSIDFNGRGRILFSTMYRGMFSLEFDHIDKLDSITSLGQNQAILSHNGKIVTVQDGGISLYEKNKLIAEQRTYPFNVTMEYYGCKRIDNSIFLFTSKGNFLVTENKILHLHEWLGTDESVTERMSSVYKTGDSLVFTGKKLVREVTVLMDEFRPKFFIQDKIKKNLLLENEYIVRSASRFDFAVHVSNLGRVFLKEIFKNEYSLLINNSEKKIKSPTDIIIDRNRDIWVTTRNSGIFRISLEPFTKLNLHPLYEDSYIRYIGRTEDYSVILSNGEGNTFLGSKKSDFVEFPEMIVTSMTEMEGKTYISTTKGIRIIQEGDLIKDPRFEMFEGKGISLIYYGLGYFWISPEGEGLVRYDPEKDSFRNYDKLPAYFYNAIMPEDSTCILFGSNDGITIYSKDKMVELPTIVNGFNLGSYVGNSTRDIYGNCWFSLDEGLFCYKKDKTVTAITAERFLPSVLIYTLNSDDYGNLMVGTNKGITVIRVDKNAVPHASNTYNKENGFGGYETHMRSSYEDNNGNIFVGTLEGLFMIKPEFLQKKIRPIAPVIFQIQNKNVNHYYQMQGTPVFEGDNNSLNFKFKSINAKTDFVRYSFRLKGVDNEWSEWSTTSEAFYNNLKGGKYTFQVRASVDQEVISEVSTFDFEIHIPFFKTKWFIILIIGLVILANFYVLERTKKFNKKNIILSRDVGADRRIAASLLLFGAFSNTAAHLFAPRIDDSIEFHDWSTIIVGIAVFILFLIVSLSKRFLTRSNEILILGFFTLLGFNFTLAFLSDIHPFYLMAILLITFVAPFIFRGLKFAIAFGFIFIFSGIAFTFYLEEANFNQYLFLIGICIAAFMAVFMTYLRNNSLERLIFTSGVVNKGNVLVVAFDSEGKITYSSENIEEILDLKHELKGTSVSELNQYQPKFTEHKKFSNVDLKSEFQEGKIFVTPLFSKSGDIVYYQWSCKEFSEDVRVILGQDVTDKINLENYYELIVRNADDLIFQTDAQGIFTFVNDKCEEVFNRRREDLIGKPITSVVRQDFQPKVRDFYSKNFKERQKHDYFEFPIVTPGGQERWLGENLTTLLKPGASNIVIGFLGLARDITERREANAIIKEQNKDITASINYARRIQFNMLPRSVDFERTFFEHFIIFRPKDIVSGDFYWLNEVDNKTILVCADCTGHGVPGSFMTLLGINILNQIILEGKITDPGNILDNLDKRLIDVLPRDGQNRIKDGMEVVICVFDHTSEEVCYATAGGRFVITDDENEDITVLKLDGKHIGDIPQQENFSYRTDKVTLTQNQILYLFSDGYPDQFGGERNKKLSIKKFLSLIDALTHQDLQTQNEILREHLEAWIGDVPQTDDITVMGVRGIKKRKLSE
ncbi:MAG: PAS domain S-box protein [Brumimicrobium sp.]|nr:PAS domain S-box protein [Brumimicrobium sp.]